MNASVKKTVDNAKLACPTAAVTRMSDVEPKSIKWIWGDRIAAKGNLIAGDPGQGKSQLSIALAAIVSTGGSFPDGQPCEIGSVIFIACEDDPADTIRPRLDAAGADTSKVHVIDYILNSDGIRESWNLTNGIAALAKVCDEMGDVSLIVVDPISAYMGGSDSHSNADVRGVLRPLMELADEYGAAVLMISHLNKASGSDAMTRVNGSGAFVAATRASFLIGRHPEIDDAYAMATLKTNLSCDKSAIGYRVVSATTEDGIETSKVEWIPGVLNIDADELLAGPRAEVDLDANSAKAEAAVFIMEKLREGPVLSSAMFTDADSMGIAESTLKRAKKVLAIRSDKIDGRWCWKMPSRSDSAQGGHDTAPLDSDPLDTLDPLTSQEGQEGQEVQGSTGGEPEPLADGSSENDGGVDFL